MQWFDVTVPIRDGMIVFPGDPEARVTRVRALADGAPYNLTRLELGAHTGTHVDAPVHFIAGASGIEGLALDALLGAAHVVDATHLTSQLDADALAALAIPRGCERLILKTSNSTLWERAAFDPSFLALTEGGARWLRDRVVRLVGIDYLSIAPFDDPAPTHRTLLAAGIVVLEGLDLRLVQPGPYTLVCMPLLIPGSDGAPARVLLGREDPAE